MPTYTEIVERFKQGDCTLTTTEDEYNKLKNHMASVFGFIATCGHENTVTLTNFWYKGTGKICKECMKKKVSEKNTKSRVDYDSHAQEYDGYEKIASYIEDEFEIEKTNEGCLSDMLVRPKYMKDDKWMMIQLKTTKDICHNLYTFSFRNSYYPNCIIVCICLKDEKLWVLDNTEVFGKSKLNIGVTTKSEYLVNQVSSKNVSEKLHTIYALSSKVRYASGMLPLSINQQQEQSYRLLREQKLCFLNFEYPKVEAREYDFLVNGYKIQEKVATIAKKNTKNPLSIVGLYRTGTKGGHTHTCYNKGDNDFYWIWKKDNKTTFYIIPEQTLIHKKKIQVDGNLDNKSKSFVLSEWTEDFAYSLDDPKLQHKLEQLFARI